MSKRNKVASVMFTGAVVAATATPAAAQTSNWTITPGGPIRIGNNTPLLNAVATVIGPVSWV